MEEVGALIKRLREEKELSQKQLAALSGVDRGYINQHEAGKEGSISLRIARKLAKGLGVPPEVFLRSPDSESLPSHSPSQVLSDIEASIRAYIPVYAEVSAGEGIETEPVDWVACTRVKAAPETLRAYRVNGLCLTPEIIEGDTLIIDTALWPNNGDLVIVVIDGKAAVKRYKENGEGTKWLEDNHGKYKPENCYLHGVVTEYVRKAR